MKTRIRQATAGDLEKIHRMIKVYAAKELLLPKSKAQLAVMLPNYLVAEYDGQFAGCVAFQIREDVKAEIISWVVEESFHNNGIGSMLISEVMERVIDLGIKNIYTLTLRPNTFVKHGFKEIPKEQLPKKVWTDCINCPRNIAEPGSVNCPEIALIRKL